MGEQLMCFYGDDFTGSTDAMEALTKSGVRTVLFLDMPNPEVIKEKFPDIQAFGIAGTSRTMNPKEMEIELTPLFKLIKRLDIPIFHYKTCSTFDSSPEIGSIGKVMEIGKKAFDPATIPLLVGAPALNRFTIFGNHFAMVKDEVYRLDRHPIMSNHPITPMNEADIGMHLSKQTDLNIGLINKILLNKSREELQKELELQENDITIFDALTEDDMFKIGSAMWNYKEDGTKFIVGSSGVEYALSGYWKQYNIIQDEQVQQVKTETKQVLAVSGSASILTKEQIEYADRNGFEKIKFPAIEILDPATSDETYQKFLNQIIKLIKDDKNPLVYTAMGPNDPYIKQTKDFMESIGKDPLKIGKLIGDQLGSIIFEALNQTDVKRVVIAGGDTSSYSTLKMGLYGLEMIAPIAPGAPLCKSYSDDARFDGLEIALKGGQLGQTDYFVKVHHGG